MGLLARRPRRAESSRRDETRRNGRRPFSISNSRVDLWRALKDRTTFLVEEGVDSTLGWVEGRWGRESANNPRLLRLILDWL